MAQSLSARNRITAAYQEIASLLAADGTYALATIQAPGAVGSLRIDDASGGTYIGKALLPGALSSAAVWQILFLSVSGNVTSGVLPNGSTAFDQIWNNRASLSYS